MMASEESRSPVHGDSGQCAPARSVQHVGNGEFRACTEQFSTSGGGVRIGRGLPKRRRPRCWVPAVAKMLETQTPLSTRVPHICRIPTVHMHVQHQMYPPRARHLSAACACRVPDANMACDGCCLYAVLGCMSASGHNFDSTATVDDGSCVVRSPPPSPPPPSMPPSCPPPSPPRCV